MLPVAADAFITARVTSETKALMRGLAERQGVTESRLLKDLIEVTLRNAGTVLPAPPPERVSRSARLAVRLHPEDWGLLKKRALDRRLPSATYVSLLVRAHLRSLAPLPRTEYLTLKRSVLELAAIGRNLNQIARAINQGEKPALPGFAEFDAILKVTVGLRDHFKALLMANQRSWNDGLQTSH